MFYKVVIEVEAKNAIDARQKTAAALNRAYLNPSNRPVIKDVTYIQRCLCGFADPKMEDGDLLCSRCRVGNEKEGHHV